jgi:hypothetical protein
MVDYHVPNKMDIDWVYTIFRQTLIRPNLFAWVETEFFMSAEPQKAGFVCSKALQKGLCVKVFRKTIWQLKHFAKPRPKEKWTYAYTLSMVPVSFSELNPWIPLICTSPSPCYFSSPMHHQLSKKVGRCLLWVSLPPRHHQDAVAHEPLESSALLRCPELSWPQFFSPWYTMISRPWLPPWLINGEPRALSTCGVLLGSPAKISYFFTWFRWPQGNWHHLQIHSKSKPRWAVC